MVDHVRCSMRVNRLAINLYSSVSSFASRASNPYPTVVCFLNLIKKPVHSLLFSVYQFRHLTVLFALSRSFAYSLAWP